LATTPDGRCCQPAPAETGSTPALPQGPNVTPPEGRAGAAAVTEEKEDTGKGLCATLAPLAIEARIAWQRRILADLERQVAERIDKLEARIGELKEWVAARNEIAARANSSLVQVVTRMKPEAAARQLAAMDEVVASGLLMKLDPRAAAAVLGDLPAQKAARLSTLIAAAGRPDRPTAEERDRPGPRGERSPGAKP
jgi:flagellar motility protein MotE (MotC chaperone)